MKVIDKPRPKKKPAATQHGEEITPNTLTAYCHPERRYTPLLKPERTIRGGVTLTTGVCACGADTWRVGGAGSGDGDAAA